ncbi:MAG: cobyrinate a,c-diamide synthase, partial [Candidatus Tectomicrobia bacterium]|nr:cobyrinate a,c-diamide synthase [Candidatus Tectomicrobia bacterium]
SSNVSMRTSIRAAAARGLPIYAECGGFMYLAQELEDLEGHTYAMAGVLPGRSILKDTRLTLGYRTLRALHSTCLLAAGETVRGHEFHFSSMQDASATVPAAYEVMDQPGRLEGAVLQHVLASYMHIHLGSKASLAPRLVAACADAR